MLNVYHYREVVEFSDDEAAPYVRKPLDVYQVGTTTPAVIYSDVDLTTPIAGSTITTDADGEIEFWATVASVDIVRRRGGARSTVTGDPGAVDELRFTRQLYLR